jgi:two-component system OmpR family sensor kinase
LLQSEKKSLFRFLAIYLGSTFLLFSLASWIFYTSAKHHLVDQQIAVLKYESGQIKSALRLLHQSSDKILHYPQSRLVNSAIYDLDKRYIFGTFANPPALDDYHDKTKLYHVVKIEPYYLGAAYLLVSKDLNDAPIYNLQKNLFFFMLGAGIFFSLLGYFLGRLFVAPMRDSLEQMNHFIQDTTHELNTPISTILMNIEMIEALDKHHEHSAELQRIGIASKTLSRIYDDLTYLNLNHAYHRQIVQVDMQALLRERLVYFEAMAKVKDIKISCVCEEVVILDIDKNDALRLVDNLISNAIKYNKMAGWLEVVLTSSSFSVKDSGIGIKSSDMQRIHGRFKRANKSDGGFGIGLDIVNQVVKSYGFVLEINSKEGIGTEVVLRWER